MPKKFNVSARAGIALLIAVVLTVVAMGIAWVVHSDADGADLRYTSADYDVTVQDNGDLRISQTIDIHLDKRESDDQVKPWKQMYQQYKLNSKNLLDITDISVTDLSTNHKYTQSAPVVASMESDALWDQQHAGTWYIADVSGGDSDQRPYTPISRPTTGAERAERKTVEIGWNIPITESAESLKFRIDMTWRGMGTSYNDITSIKWEPFGASNQTPIRDLSIKLRMPSMCTASNSLTGNYRDGKSADCRTWVHYSKNATTQLDDGMLVIHAINVPVDTYLDVVALWPTVSGDEAQRRVHKDYRAVLEKLEMQEESDWQQQQQKQAQLKVVSWILVAVGGLALGIFGVVRAMKLQKYASYLGGIEYYRDPLSITPASAAVLCKVLTTGTELGAESEQMGSTMLSLISRGFVGVYPGPASMYAGYDMSKVNPAGLAQFAEQRFAADPKLAKNKTSTIVLLPMCFDDAAVAQLSASEQALLDMLKYVCLLLNNTPVFDMKTMTKQMRKHDSQSLKKLNAFKKACQDEVDALHAVTDVRGGGFVCSILACILGIVSMFMFVVGGAGNVALAVLISFPILLLGLIGSMIMPTRVFTGQPEVNAVDAMQMAANNSGAAAGVPGAPATTAVSTTHVPSFAQQGDGQKLAGQVQGLYRYLTEFSDFSDRGVPDLVLWDRYLVYATAFGVADKVLHQMRQAYPQLNDQSWLDANVNSPSSILYWSMRPHFYSSSTMSMADTMGMGGFNDLGSMLSSSFSEVSSTIRSASGGGGFSGGSFGGSGGGGGGGSFGGR
ncbi:hypothetical protein D2E26_1091 [Bifidobacterium dolichotidis]|uniref:DUF2207 domain-containing protein n=1 Tax=Bifidobacterium dolichotidis TaxID=2306976 RepID=A0A430FQC9_9BIFI|nr:DUF2207 domain-containing protein [Bifidobacterium dolichotidis]RSX55037.1 hypothetical protein D2E26_1091 [Bifidobacterium dolichotidis]